MPAIVKTRQPGIQVLLKKNVGRKTVNGQSPVSTQWAGQNSTIDLTTWLAEKMPVRVRKSVREPAGAFQIALADKIDPQVLDTIYSVIEPMDVIEIRFGGDAYTYAANGLPIIMRGFVSKVRRSNGMDADGKPRRIVSVSGHDYGKILQRYQIFFLPNVPLDAQQMINSFPFFTKFGDFPNTATASGFVQAVVDQIVNPYLAQMQANSPNASAVMQLSKDIQVGAGVVSPFGIGTYRQGTLFALLQQHCDVGAWNELFIEDRADAPYLVYRPNPAADIVTGDWLMAETATDSATLPLSVEIDQTDVVSYDCGRTDANVSNIFWVDAPRYITNYDMTWKALAYQAPSTDEASPVNASAYGNLNPQLYGWSRMQENTQQGGPQEMNNGNGTPDGQQRNQGNMNALDWITLRRKQLYNQNKDNVVFESGSMYLKGNELIKAGGFVALTHGNLRSQHYAVAVDHEYIPFGNFFTSVEFERGTGFADRVMQGDGMQNPYYSEMVQNPPVSGVPLVSSGAQPNTPLNP